MAIAVTALKNGMTLEYKDGIWEAVSTEFMKPGKGAAFVRARLKHVISGKVEDVTWRSHEKVEPVRVERRQLEYLFRSGNSFTFMVPETGEQVEVALEKVEASLPYLKENDTVTLMFHGELVLAVEPPAFVELEVVDAEPGVKGDTASSTTKNCTVETGASIKVPIFVNKGDRIKVDTRTGEYVSRV